MDVIDNITKAVELPLDELGYTLVLVRFNDGAGRKTLTLMAERKDGKGMSFEDCTTISRHVGTLLDVEDPITGAYDLEVSSPGLDRPLTKLADYSRFKGYEMKLETKLPMDNRRKFRGVIKSVSDEKITVTLPDGEVREVEIAFSNIRSAKLVVTDAMLKEVRG